MNEELKIDKEYIAELLNNEPFKDKIQELENETDELSSYRKKLVLEQRKLYEQIHDMIDMFNIMDSKSYSVNKVIIENNTKINNLKGYSNKEISNFNKRTVLSLKEEHTEE
ncbi:hypothetical protein [Staphylococcus phage vB_SsapH-Golestan101-M]|nr:hypothetical protein [Staphylococcus phage vB_SsapH-Golestan101-M]